MTLAASTTRRRALMAMAALGVARLTRAQPASTYPTRLVRLIVPYAAGGPTDALARVIGAELSRRWNQPVIVDNRPGANAVLGADIAARAPADGYTLFQGTASTHGINPYFYAKLPYDPVRDFTPVVAMSESCLYLVVNAKLPVDNVAGLLRHLRQRSGAATFGSLGAGSIHEIAGELLQRAAGVRMIEVPYKGTAPAMTALMAGDIDVLFDSNALQQAKAGRVKILAVTSPQRWPITPEIPTLAEQGLANFDLPNGWFAIFLPKGAPSAIVDKINHDVNEVLLMPEVRSKLATFGHVAVGGTPLELQARVQAALALGARVAKEFKPNVER